MNEELLKSGRLALQNSYSPYSNFPVGAALRAADGTIFTGTNVENISYGLSMCAERIAVFNALSNGHRSFKELAITSSAGKPVFPCGACLQVLAEFSPDLVVYLEGNQQKSFKLSELLPYAFKNEMVQKK